MTDESTGEAMSEAPGEAQTNTQTDEAVAAAPEPRVVSPPRPFDADEPEPLPLEASADEAPEEAEPPIEIIETDAAPEQAAMFDDLSQLPALLEALLFVADHPIDSGYLARAVDVSVVTCEKALDLLAEQLREGSRGIRLQRGPEGVQLTSAPDAAAHVERFLGLEANKRLSTAALETLAIIAYRQPITRGQVDAVRGVSSDGAVATLRARGLIEAAGFAAGPGRPMLFRTTQRFLEHFGLERPGQLPALPDDIDLPAAEIGAQLGLDEAEIIAALTPLPTEEANASATEGELTPEDVVAAASIEIPADVQALSDAAEHALQAQRDREQAEAGADEDTPDDESAEA